MWLSLILLFYLGEFFLVSMYMPVATHSIVFARIVPSELNIVTAENNNVIDLALQRQLKVGAYGNATDGQDIWQQRDNFTGAPGANVFEKRNLLLKWSEFQNHFYGGGDGDFALSQIVGRRLTLIGVKGEYANGIGQETSSLTHMSDRGSGDAKISGVSVMNDVIDSVVLDLGLPHEAWDSCSYMNVVNNLQDVHTLEDVTRVEGKLQQSCSLSMTQLVHEISSNYDENVGVSAVDATSAVFQLYNKGLDTAIELAMDARPTTATTSGAGGGTNAMHDLVLSVMFKNSTPGVRNVEFRIHMLVAHNGTGYIGPFVATNGTAGQLATADPSFANNVVTFTDGTHGLATGNVITVTGPAVGTASGTKVNSTAVPTNASGTVTFTSAGHGLANGDLVTLTTDGTHADDLTYVGSNLTVANVNAGAGTFDVTIATAAATVNSAAVADFHFQRETVANDALYAATEAKISVTGVNTFTYTPAANPALTTTTAFTANAFGTISYQVIGSASGVDLTDVIVDANADGALPLNGVST